MNPRLLTRSLFVLLPLICLNFHIFAQEVTVSGYRVARGKVIDAKTGKPLPGATIKVKNGKESTVSNDEGAFSIKIPSSESVLSISHIGYLLYERKAGEGELTISLTQNISQLEDVVVSIGYGSKKKPNIVGAVSIIRAEDIQDFPVANLGTALANRIPGVGVSVASGKPGAPTTVTIRNPTLFAASGKLGLTQDPLFVIDGITVTKQDFNDLDASLVETITFLKDASAAVYGASGDKGVILITTKRGKPGKAKINYAGYYGNTTATVKPHVLSAYEHAKMLNDGYDLANADNTLRFSQADLDFLKTNPYKSWYDELWKPANLMRHTVNVSGGSEKITFFAGANYYNEDGNFGKISIKKYGIRSGMDARISPSVTASISVNTDYSTDYRNTYKSSSTDGEDLMVRALFLTPQWVPLTINGKPNNWDKSPNQPGPWNPIALFNSGDYEKNISQALTLNASMEYKPLFLKGLTAKVQFGKINRSGTSKQYFPPYTVYNFVKGGQNGLFYTTTPAATPTTLLSNVNRLQEGTNYANSYQLFGSLDYAKKLGKHEFDLLLLTEQMESESNSYLTYRDGQQIPNIDQLFAFNASTTTVQLNGALESGKRSYLTRLNYAFNDRYLLEFVGRLDGSANFPPDKRWGFFPALGVGWKVSEEDFFRNNFSFINFFKLRANVGLVGDDRVQSYQYMSRFTQSPSAMLFGTAITNGLDPNIFPNPDITWEKARTQNYGIDASFLNTKLTVSVDIWNRHTFDGFDDLATVNLPYTVGISTGLKNYGIQNAWGTEFSIGYRDNINSNWGYSADLNFGTSGNQIVQQYYSPGKLGGVTEYADVPIGRSSNKYTSSNYGYITKGILRTQAEVDALLAKNPNYKIGGLKPQVGFMDFVDQNNDGVIEDKDIVPMFENIASRVGFGLTLGVSYKTFRLSTNLSLSVGGKKFFDSEARKVPTTNQSAPDFWKDHWTPDNPNAKYPRYDAPLAKENSDFWAVDGTTARVNNMTLTYAMPREISERLKIPDFRVVVSGFNLWNIINPYKYKDPATGSFASYPTLRTLSVGVNMSL